MSDEEKRPTKTLTDVHRQKISKSVRLALKQKQYKQTRQVAEQRAVDRTSSSITKPPPPEEM